MSGIGLTEIFLIELAKSADGRIVGTVTAAIEFRASLMFHVRHFPLLGQYFPAHTRSTKIVCAAIILFSGRGHAVAAARGAPVGLKIVGKYEAANRLDDVRPPAL